MGKTEFMHELYKFLRVNDTNYSGKNITLYESVWWFPVMEDTVEEVQAKVDQNDIFFSEKIALIVRTKVVYITHKVLYYAFFVKITLITVTLTAVLFGCIFWLIVSFLTLLFIF